MAKYKLNETYYRRIDNVWEIEISDEQLAQYMKDNDIEDKDEALNDYMWSFEWTDNGKLLDEDDTGETHMPTELDWESLDNQ